MASAAEQLLIRIDGDMSRLRQELQKAEATTVASGARMTSSINKLDVGFSALSRTVSRFGALLGIAGVGGLAILGKHALDAAGGIGELAEQVGVSAQSLQVYQFAALQSGIGTETLNASLMKLTRSIGDAAKGTGEQYDAFKRLGVAFRDVNGASRATDDVLRDLADAYVRSGDKTIFAADAAMLLGRSGQKLIPILSGGSAGLDKFAAAATSAGAVLSDQLIGQADKASDKIAVLEHTFDKLAQTLMAKAAPGLTAFLDGLNKLIAPTTTDRVERLKKEIEALGKITPSQTEDWKNVNKRMQAAQAELEQLTEVQAKIDAVRGGAAPAAGFVEPIKMGPDPFMKGQTDAIKEWQQKSAQMKKDADRESEQSMQKLAQRSQQITESMRTPVEDYSARLVELNKLMELGPEKGGVSMETYGRAVRAAQTELDQATIKQQELTGAAREFAGAIDNAFDQAIRSGGDFRSVVRGLIADLSSALIKQATGGQSLGGMLIGGLSGMFGGGNFTSQANAIHSIGLSVARGGVFNSGRVVPMARGGIVSSPTMFPMANGTGLMGEAGPEAVMPLARGPGGRLGVRAQGGGGGGSTINVTQVFQTGVSRADLAGILPLWRQQTVAAVREARLRDPGYFGARG